MDFSALQAHDGETPWNFYVPPGGSGIKRHGGVPLGNRLNRTERKAALEPLAEFRGWGYGGVNRGRIVDVAGSCWH